jgi:hypothetical protein
MRTACASEERGNEAIFKLLNPLFSFVTVYGNATITQDNPDELLKWATTIAERYMGKENAERYGKRNSVKGELAVRVKPTTRLSPRKI